MTGPQDQDWDAYPPGALPPAGRPAAPPAYGAPAVFGPPPGYGSPPAYGPPPGYGPAPSYGPPPGHGWYPVEPPAWPHGPGTPGVATAAAVLGYVTAGLTVLVSGGVLLSVLAGEDDPVSVVLTLGLPCAAALVAGGVRLQARRSPALLLGAALASVAVLGSAWVAGAVTIDRSGGLTGLVLFLAAAAVLPVLTAVFAGLRVVREWAAARPR